MKYNLIYKVALWDISHLVRNKLRITFFMHFLSIVIKFPESQAYTVTQTCLMPDITKLSFKRFNVNLWTPLYKMIFSVFFSLFFLAKAAQTSHNKWNNTDTTEWSDFWLIGDFDRLKSPKFEHNSSINK